MKGARFAWFLVHNKKPLLHSAGAPPLSNILLGSDFESIWGRFWDRFWIDLAIDFRIGCGSILGLIWWFDF